MFLQRARHLLVAGCVIEHHCHRSSTLSPAPLHPLHEGQESAGELAPLHSHHHITAHVVILPQAQRVCWSAARNLDTAQDDELSVCALRHPPWTRPEHLCEPQTAAYCCTLVLYFRIQLFELRL